MAELGEGSWGTAMPSWHCNGERFGGYLGCSAPAALLHPLPDPRWPGGPSLHQEAPLDVVCKG